MQTYKNIHAICDKVTEISIYVTIFFLPGSNRIAEISTGIGISAWLINKIISRDIKSVRTTLSIPILAYLAVNFFSLILTTNFYISLRALICKAIQYAMVYLLAVETINTEKRLRNIIKVLFASAVVVSIDGIIQHYTKIELLRNRPMELTGVTGPFKNQNDLGSYLSLILPIALSFALFIKGARKKILMLLISFPILICLIATYSRGAWVASFIGVLTIICIKKKHLIPFFFIILITAFFFMPPSVKSRTWRIFDMNEHTMSQRKILWKTGFDMMLAHPVTGQGVGTFMYNFSKYRPHGFSGVYYAHNCFLQLAAEIGLFGLAAFIWILIAFFRNAFNIIKRLDNGFHLAALMGLTGGIIAFLLHSVVDTNLYSLPLAMLFWMCLGISLSTIRNATKEDTLCPNR